MSTSQFLLPVHLIEEVLGAQEEVVDLAALFVSLCGVVHAQLGLLREELADVGHGEDDLLHGSVQAHDLSGNHKLHSTPCETVTGSTPTIHENTRAFSRGLFYDRRIKAAVDSHLSSYGFSSNTGHPVRFILHNRRGVFQGVDPKWLAETGSTDLYLSRVLGIELQGFVALAVRPACFQHGLQLLVMSGQLYVCTQRKVSVGDSSVSYQITQVVI